MLYTEKELSHFFNSEQKLQRKLISLKHLLQGKLEFPEIYRNDCYLQNGLIVCAKS